jgi:hypothetical protein
MRGIIYVLSISVIRIRREVLCVDTRGSFFCFMVFSPCVFFFNKYHVYYKMQQVLIVLAMKGIGHIFNSIIENRVFFW